MSPEVVLSIHAVTRHSSPQSPGRRVQLWTLTQTRGNAAREMTALDWLQTSGFPIHHSLVLSKKLRGVCLKKSQDDDQLVSKELRARIVKHDLRVRVTQGSEEI